MTSISWGEGEDPAASLTIGEFAQGAAYHTIRRRGTPNCLLIATLQGSGRILDGSGKATATEVGDILLFDPDTYHNYGTAPEAGEWALIWSHFFPPSGWSHWRSWPSPWPGLWKIHLGPITLGRLANELRLVHAADFGTGELLGKFMVNCLERAFLHIRRFEERGGQPARDARIEKALHHILDNLSAPLDVSDIARHCGLSVSRLAHLFRDVTGTTPQRFIETNRMQLARNLLRFSSLPVAEVSRACGFEDAYYFSTRFRKHHNLSPRAYREGPQTLQA